MNFNKWFSDQTGIPMGHDAYLEQQNTKAASKEPDDALLPYNVSWAYDDNGGIAYFTKCIRCDQAFEILFDIAEFNEAVEENYYCGGSPHCCP